MKVYVRGNTSFTTDVAESPIENFAGSHSDSKLKARDFNSDATTTPYPVPVGKRTSSANEHSRIIYIPYIQGVMYVIVYDAL